MVHTFDIELYLMVGLLLGVGVYLFFDCGGAAAAQSAALAAEAIGAVSQL
jgi:hypothetical protein